MAVCPTKAMLCLDQPSETVTGSPSATAVTSAEKVSREPHSCECQSIPSHRMLGRRYDRFLLSAVLFYRLAQRARRQHQL
jgi:hypothetical protein